VAFVDKTTKKTYINANKLRFLKKNSERTVTGVVCSEMQPPGFVLLREICTLPGSVQVRSQPKGVKPKIRERKVRSGVNLLWDVKAKKA